MSKLTPGPWKAKSNNPALEFSWEIYNNEHSKWPIAVGIRKEDTRLMAASPTMLKWLKWLRDSMGTEHYPSDVTFDGYGLNELIHDAEGGD